jgi:hypothetical protein
VWRRPGAREYHAHDSDDSNDSDEPDDPYEQPDTLHEPDKLHQPDALDEPDEPNELCAVYEPRDHDDSHGSRESHEPGGSGQCAVTRWR